jgi:hypothetical protein
MALSLILLSASVEAATIVVTSAPAGATAAVDGTSSKQTPCRFSVPSGKHVLVLKKAGYEELRHEFEVGSSVEVLRLKLERKRYPVNILFKDTTEDTLDWYVFAKGQPIGRVPGTIRLVCGRTQLLLLKEGFRDIRVNITVAETEQLVELKKPVRGISSWSKVPFLRFVGMWEKQDSGTLLILAPDKTFRVTTPDGRTRWTGQWTANKSSVSITVWDRPCLLLLKPDGTLSGKDTHQNRWVLRPIEEKR